MKKITLLIVSMLMVTLLAMAQIKFIVYKADGSTIELLATEVDSIGFEGNNVQPETPDSPNNPDTPNANGHEYVDLGLPSGTLWATMNVGATSAEDYGDYFCWGEISPRTTEYEQENYKWYDGEKYSEKDKRTVLEYEDDAARANWGGDWRMPTKNELEELVKNCNINIIIKNDNVYYKLISIKNNKSIILPIPGAYAITGPYPLELDGVGNMGYYYSSEMYEEEYSFAIITYYDGRYIYENTPEEDLKLFMRGEGPLRPFFAASVRAVLPSKKVYTITFNANGGRGNMSFVDADYSELFTIPTNRFTHTQQDFVCWNTKADGSGKTYMETDKFSVSSDITLYAQWYKTYTLKFDINGGTFGNMNDIEVKEDSKEQWMKLPKNEFSHWYSDEYEFAGWNTKPDGSGTSYADEQEIFISSNITLYAQWKKIGVVDIPEDMPILSNPGEGKTTLCVYIPNSDCEEAELYAIGELPGGRGWWENVEALKMKRCEDRENWWEVTLDALNEENATNFKFRMDDGANGWKYELRATYEFIPTDYLKVKEDENLNLVAIADCDNQVLYIKCGKWNTPCIERNQAGTATFTLTAPELPEGAVVGIYGNLNDWNISDPVVMTQIDNNTYKATVTVCEECEYRYIFSLDGGVTWSWDNVEDGVIRFMPHDLIADDIVETWKFAYDLGTFTLTAPELPEGAVVGIVGDLNAWNIDAPILMEKGEGNTWTANAYVQKDCVYNCVYRYVFSLDGGVTWSWDNVEDGDVRYMPLGFNAIDTVEAWYGLPLDE